MKKIQVVFSTKSGLFQETKTGPGLRNFCKDFTVNLSSQCRAFIGALTTKTLKALVFPGPVGAETTDDCALRVITLHGYLKYLL